MTIPLEQREEALKLDPKAEIELYEIFLRDNATVFRFRDGPGVVWQAMEFEGLPCQMTGEKTTSDEEENRPALRVINPKKVFGPYVKQGLVELARVTRWKVLQQHLDANANIFTKRVWIVGRVSACTSQLLELELRSPLDGPTWVIPGRSYQPPEFPFVSF